ncbi:UbiH/UbiF/VisC/COQ6 family ubiquinone biosynthesis hydroxylase [bacterium]|nr:UbiH/UbiF/VisC/COQ6 family ubiquinone biosynthesis hydroxylase [bacterium]
MSKKLSFDCIVIGGGLSGLTTTLALSKIGLSVAIIDKTSLKMAKKNEGDQRTTAVSASGKKVFEALDIWDSLKKGAEPILDIVVSEKGKKGHLNFDHQTVGTEPMGHILNNIELKNSLISSIRSQKNIQLFPFKSLNNFFPKTGAVSIDLNDGSSYEAALLVAADGRNSDGRRIAKIKSTNIDYNQSSIVFTVGHEKPHRGTAYEQFTTGGPIASLPMRGNKSSVVWSEDTEVIGSLMQLDDKDFAAAASYRLNDCLGKMTIIGQRKVFPLKLNYADTIIANRFAMVGDAAHGLHPIAGQGFNLGLRDIANLTEEISNARRLGLDIGSFETLRSYQAARRFDNFSLVAATHGLNRLFTDNNKIVRFIRSSGLDTINTMNPIKNLFMRLAMGEVGSLPHLLKGQLP